MAGIAWGIASIVLIVAMGDGFKEGQRNNMKGLGQNIVIVFGGRTEYRPAASGPGGACGSPRPMFENVRARRLPGEEGRGRAGEPA